LVAIAKHGAAIVGSSSTDGITTVALARVLDTSQLVTSIVARVHALLRGHGTGNVSTDGEGTRVSSVGPASLRDPVAVRGEDVGGSRSGSSLGRLGSTIGGSWGSSGRSTILVNVETVSTTAIVGRITLASHVAATIRSSDGGHGVAAEALLRVLDTGNRVSSGLASVDTFLDGHGGGTTSDGHTDGHGALTIDTIDVAALRDVSSVVREDRGASGGSGRTSRSGSSSSSIGSGARSVKVDIKTVSTTAVLVSVTLAGHIAATVRSGYGGGRITAPTFLSVFETSVRVSSSVASVQAFLDGHGVGTTGYTLSDGESTSVNTIHIAPLRAPSIVGLNGGRTSGRSNGLGGGRGSSGRSGGTRSDGSTILVDGQEVSGTAEVGSVTVARHVASGLVGDVGASIDDGVTAVAFTAIFHTGVLEVGTRAGIHTFLGGKVGDAHWCGQSAAINVVAATLLVNLFLF
jgi:hypothetical protein